MAHGDAREGKWRGNWRMEWVASTLTLPQNAVYPALLTLKRTPLMPVVDWTDAPTDLNGLVRFGRRRDLVSEGVPSRFKRSLPTITAQIYSMGLPGCKSGYWRGEFPYTKGRSVSAANCCEYKTEHNRRKCSQWETAYFPARFMKETFFILLHISVCAELLKALQKKEVFLSHSGIQTLPLLLKLHGDARQYYGLILGSCTVLWSSLKHHMVQKPIRRPQLDKQQPWNPGILRNVPYSREGSWPSQRAQIPLTLEMKVEGKHTDPVKNTTITARSDSTGHLLSVAFITSLTSNSCTGLNIQNTNIYKEQNSTKNHCIYLQAEHTTSLQPKCSFNWNTSVGSHEKAGWGWGEDRLSPVQTIVKVSCTLRSQ